MRTARRVGDFVEHRLGLGTFLRSSFTDKRPPAGIGFLRTIGYAALTVMALQFLSGIALAMHYVPSEELAYPSILALEAEVPLGAFTRSLHHFGASAFVIFAVLHMLRVFFTGAYKAPRELTWVTGAGLLFVVLGFGFTGYLLPWDQKAYFATKVGTEIAADTPLVGDQVRAMLRGGTEVGQATLSRFYVIHVVILPIALLGVLGLHLYLIQRHGVAAPRRRVGDEGEKGVPYFPHHTFKEALVGCGVAALLFGLASTFRAPLEPLAEPADTAYHPRPDWYFLGLFQLLKVFTTHRELGTFWVPTLFFTALLLLPFLDRSPHRYWRDRKVMVPIGIVVCMIVAGLTIAGALDSPGTPPTATGAPPVAAATDGEAAPEAAADADAAAVDLGPPLPYPLEYTPFERRGYRLTRRLNCVDCHRLERDGVVHGRTRFHAPDLDDLGLDSLLDIAAVLEEPPPDMPAFTHLPLADRLAIGAYVARLNRR